MESCGSLEKAAHLVGINVQGVKVSVFVLTGILVGFASFVQACKIGNVTPASSGKSYEMYAIASVVLGGINMAGGRGNILGVFSAPCLIMQLILLLSVSHHSVPISRTHSRGWS